jgi:protein gp37
MGIDTGIQWCHHTFNPWRGCTKVSAGCANCYAETLSKRNPKVLGVWGDDGTRVIAAESYWRQPIAWDVAAEASGERRRVFCASLGDVFEDRTDLIAPRCRLWKLIEATPNLDWLLLTKRPENVEGALRSERIGKWLPGNVWLGVSVEHQAAAEERVPRLKAIPARVRFLSIEPLIAPISFRMPELFGIDWAIVGGESGPRARPFDLAWARSIRDQCRAAGVAFFLKQLGSRCVGYWLDPEAPGDAICYHSPDHGWKLRDSHGGDESEWPIDLRGCRAFPI